VTRANEDMALEPAASSKVGERRRARGNTDD
jgi:hypothetical protein